MMVGEIHKTNKVDCWYLGNTIEAKIGENYIRPSLTNQEVSRTTVTLATVTTVCRWPRPHPD